MLARLRSFDLSYSQAQATPNEFVTTFSQQEEIQNMNTKELLAALDDLDYQGVWLFNSAMLMNVFPNETTKTLLSSLNRHVKSGLLKKVKKGLYANERARCAPIKRLEALVPYLRPRAINYISQESRLAELGVISQMPIDHMTFMTTGRTQTFKTCYGTLEFTHTDRQPKSILAETIVDSESGHLIATAERALRDLRRAGRNTKLVDMAIYQEITSTPNG